MTLRLRLSVGFAVYKGICLSRRTKDKKTTTKNTVDESAPLVEGASREGASHEGASREGASHEGALMTSRFFAAVLRGRAKINSHF